MLEHWTIMCEDTEVAIIEFDSTEMSEVAKYTPLVPDVFGTPYYLSLPFYTGCVKPTITELLEYISDERLMPSTRENIDEELEERGLNAYDPIAFVKKTHGIMAEDHDWIRFGDEKLTFKEVDFYKRPYFSDKG